MSEVFLGEVHILAFPWAPRGWAQCNGNLLNVSQNAALFSLLGNRFGGDGVTNFALPDLRKRVPLCTGTNAHSKSNFVIGAKGGAMQSAMTMANMPSHAHPVTPPPATSQPYTLTAEMAVPVSTQPGNVSAVPGASLVLGVVGENAGSGSTVPLYTTDAPNVNLATTSVALQGETTELSQTNPVGAGAPFNIAMPYQVVNYIIAISGNFPSRG